MRRGNSLKSQALGYLSRREYSRQELRTKLLVALKRRRAEIAAAAAADPSVHPCVDPFGNLPTDPPADPLEAMDSGAEVDALLDWLEEKKYLSDARFVESRVHARAARHGGLRIRQELARHGLEMDVAQASALRETEFARAQQVWQRKFGAVAVDLKERGRQARFLAGRGFTAEVVRRIVGGPDDGD